MISFPPTGITVPLYPWILWNLWTSRNKLLFEDKSFAGKEVVEKAIVEARSWQNAQIQGSTPPKASRPVTTKPISSSSATKCFSDASWLASSWRCGLGWVFQDSNGAYFGHGSSHRSVVGSALAAEALAVKACLTAAISSGHRRLECFSDSKTLVLLLARKEWAVEIQGVLHDIFFLCSSFDFISFSFTPRLSNVIADGLAKSACLNSSVMPVGAWLF